MVPAIYGYALRSRFPVLPLPDVVRGWCHFTQLPRLYVDIHTFAGGASPPVSTHGSFYIPHRVPATVPYGYTPIPHYALPFLLRRSFVRSFAAVTPLHDAVTVTSPRSRLPFTFYRPLLHSVTPPAAFPTLYVLHVALPVVYHAHYTCLLRVTYLTHTFTPPPAVATRSHTTLPRTHTRFIVGLPTRYVLFMDYGFRYDIFGRSRVLFVAVPLPRTSFTLRSFTDLRCLVWCRSLPGLPAFAHCLRSHLLPRRCTATSFCLRIHLLLLPPAYPLRFTLPFMPLRSTCTHYLVYAVLPHLTTVYGLRLLRVTCYTPHYTRITHPRVYLRSRLHARHVTHHLLRTHHAFTYVTHIVRLLRYASPTPAATHLPDTTAPAADVPHTAHTCYGGISTRTTTDTHTTLPPAGFYHTGCATWLPAVTAPHVCSAFCSLLRTTPGYHTSRYARTTHVTTSLLVLRPFASRLFILPRLDVRSFLHVPFRFVHLPAICNLVR